MATALVTSRRFAVVNAGFALVTVVAFAVALVVGYSTLDIGALIDGARDGGHARRLLVEYRLPRALLAVEVGAGLAVAGVAFQALLRNPLGDPYVLGVSGGAALGGTTLIALGVASPWLLAAGAYAGAVSTTILLFASARAAGRVSTTTLLLAGLVFNAFASAVITFLKMIVAGDKAQDLLYWLMGRLGDESYSTIAAVAIYVGVGFMVLMGATPSMNALALGEESAGAVGVSVERTRRVLFWAASLVVAGVVAVSGLIGFVGIITPHLARRLVGADNRVLLPASAWLGATFLLLSDAASRLFFPLLGRDLPVGVVTALVGGPLLILLLRREMRGVVYA